MTNHLSKLFTMFKRFHNHVEGTGIVLYIVKRIVENGGGFVEVESKLNKVSVFTVYMKAEKQPALPLSKHTARIDSVLIPVSQ